MKEKNYNFNKPYTIINIKGYVHAIKFRSEQLGTGVFSEKVAASMEHALNDAYKRGYLEAKNESI